MENVLVLFHTNELEKPAFQHKIQIGLSFNLTGKYIGSGKIQLTRWMDLRKSDIVFLLRRLTNFAS